MQPWTRLQKPIVVLTQDAFKDEEMQPLNREYLQMQANPFLSQPAMSSFLLWSNRCPKPMESTWRAPNGESVEDPVGRQPSAHVLAQSAVVVDLQGVNGYTSVPCTAPFH